MAALLMVTALVGCVALKPLKIQDTSGVKRIGLVVSVTQNKLGALDHTGVRYRGILPQYGAAGFLAEMLVVTVAQKVKARNSLEGSIEELSDALPVYPVGNLLTQDLVQRLSQRYEIICLEHSGKIFRVEDYLGKAREQGIDTLMNIDLIYGLAVYDGEQSSAAIDAVVSVYDVRNGKLLLEKPIRSDQQFRSGNVVSKFRADGAELFKKDIIDAADGLAMLIASELGLAKEPPRSGLFETWESGMSCTRPFSLDQDCNGLRGPSRVIELNGYKMKTAATRDGKTVVIVLCSCRRKTVDREGMETVADEGVELRKCSAAMQENLARNNIVILRTIKVKEAFLADEACVYELDQDGYSMLKRYSVDSD
ncbi:MAG: hypothetical protein WAW37_16195 [Syntrophobacteraceae bacterium]